MTASMGHNNPPARIAAEFVRIEDAQGRHQADDRWRDAPARQAPPRLPRRGSGQQRQQAQSRGLGKRETLYGRVFGKSPEGEGGIRVLFTVDPKQDWGSIDWNGPRACAACASKPAKACSSPTARSTRAPSRQPDLVHGVDQEDDGDRVLAAVAQRLPRLRPNARASLAGFMPEQHMKLSLSPPLRLPERREIVEPARLRDSGRACQ